MILFFPLGHEAQGEKHSTVLFRSTADIFLISENCINIGSGHGSLRSLLLTFNYKVMRSNHSVSVYWRFIPNYYSFAVIWLGGRVRTTHCGSFNVEVTPPCEKRIG